MTPSRWPQLGIGIGLRSEHYEHVLEYWPKMDWFEAISENYMDTGGRPLWILEQVRQHYPVGLHGVSLSIGSSDPINPHYLKRLKALIGRIEPALVSDHLCWSGIDGENLHDLLPLPFTQEALEHVIQRVVQVQETLGRTILLENVSSYVTYEHSEMPEWEFLIQIAKRSGCGILLDINNVYVNSFNHLFDAATYINAIPPELVGQFHVAGHTHKGKYLFDTHIGPTSEPVWDLYRCAIRRFGKGNTLIEWDEEIPEFKKVAQEAEKARSIVNELGSPAFS